MSGAVPSPAPIGYLGGSFDPVHRGHLQLGRDALAKLGLAEVVYLPAGQPWQKSELAPAGERLRMLEIALGGMAQARIDRREIERPGATFTVDTLRELRAELGSRHPIVWILGEDQLQRLDTWSRWEEVIHLAHIAHARRPGAEATLPMAVARMLTERSADAPALRERPAGAVVEFTMEPVDCSATRLRQALAGSAFAGSDAMDGVAHMLPAGVLEYILSHKLYGTGHGTEKSAAAGH